MKKSKFHDAGGPDTVVSPYYECLKKGTFVGQSKSKKKKPKKLKKSHVDRFKITETSTNCDLSQKTVKSESDFQANVWIKPELFDTDS